MRRIGLRIGVAATALSVVALSCCSTPPPTAVEISDAAPASPRDAPVLAPHPPPPTRVEIPPPAPSPQALWRFGHWSWNGEQFVWNPGQYIERPSPAASWIPGYWEQRPEGWIRVEGQWTSEDTT
jgi:hypothetical protein